MSRVRSALVIGGGVAGTVAALALHEAGIEVTVHEAYPDTGSGIGGALALAPNGQAALDIVGARDAVLADSVPIENSVMSFGRRRVEMPQLPDLGPMRVVRRTHLHGSLYELCVRRGIPFAHDSRLTAVEEDTAGVTARFADGSTARADVLIGADGVHSTVRRLIDPDAPGAGCTGLVGAEGLVEVDLPIEPATMYFTFGANAYYLYWRNPGGGTTFGVNLPQDRPMRLTEARAIPAGEWLARLRSVYGDDEPGGTLVRAVTPETLSVTGSLHIMPSVPHWSRGRLVLAGDAVHAPSNSSGQGASLAIESAVELARCLRDRPDHGSAFAAYERLRRGRVERITSAAAKINHVKAPGRVARVANPLVMRLLLATAMRPERLLGPVQRHRIDWAAPVESTVD